VFVPFSGSVRGLPFGARRAANSLRRPQEQRHDHLWPGPRQGILITTISVIWQKPPYGTILVVYPPPPTVLLCADPKNNVMIISGLGQDKVFLVLTSSILW